MTAVADRIKSARGQMLNERDACELALVPQIMTRCSLPQSNPGNYRALTHNDWKRECRTVTMTLYPHVETDERGQQCEIYPYGAFSRILLYWATSEAIRSKSRIIPMGRSFSNLCRHFRLHEHGKDRETLGKALRALFSCLIKFENTGPERMRWASVQFASEGDLQWNKNTVESRFTEDSYVKLSSEFFEMASENPVPIDMRAVRALRHSALALDLYVWSTYRSFLERKYPRAALTPWRELMTQMGGSYAHVPSFKRKALNALGQVQSVYPELRAESTPEGLVIRGNESSIQPNSKGGTTTVN